MITFKSVRYKNFLSTGNAGITIQLNRNTTTLIQGASGSGKSTMIDALCFGLFGKPFRKINKPQIVNSVNGKQCEVEVVFETNGKEYRVVRGIKPNRFDIYCDGTLVPQDAATVDYQHTLERIMGWSFKTFTQVVILGSTAYTPFMQLTASARREVIEDILDIGVFSSMNLLLKAQIQSTKDQQAEVDADLRAAKGEAEGLRRLIDALKQKQQQDVEQIKVYLAQLDQRIRDEEMSLGAIEIERSALQESLAGSRAVIEAKNKVANDILDLEIRRDTVKSHLEFLRDHDECPKCRQTIGNKAEHMHYDHLEVAQYEEQITTLRAQHEKLKQQALTIAEKAEKGIEYERQLSAVNATIQSLQREQITYLQRLNEKNGSTDDIDQASKDLKKIARSVIALVDKKQELASEREVQDAASMLLRDTGIKTAIIKEYLPLINRLLAIYLSKMQLDVDFTLDENFDEVIRSRYRDEFSYGNFSAGEALRLDLALLFTWRHVARVKNSASCNLLILDEILVGRLDTENSDVLMTLLDELANDGANILAISHGDHIQDKFRSLIRFEKQGNFTVML